MKQIIIIINISLFLIFGAEAQEITGYVKAKQEVEDTCEAPDDNCCESDLSALAGATLVWKGTTEGTSTNSEGFFKLEKHSRTNLLVVSYTGFKADTILVNNENLPLNIHLSGITELEEITVSRKTKGEYYSVMNPVSTQVISEAGLQKLPCCDLSESFENNASVDVSFSDAVSGAKQIRMLGLAGIYTQILRENIPTVRGLSAGYGLTYLPGSWMESVQISKGASTVTKGYESVTGQINTELKKGENSDRLFINLYGNSELRSEANLVSAHKISDELNTIVMLHGSRLNKAHDNNSDGFLDMPLYDKYTGINKWKYKAENGLESQIGLRFLKENRKGGQMSFINSAQTSEQPYGIKIQTSQYELFGKLGFPLATEKQSSIGSVYSFSLHDQNSVFGNNNYSGVQESFYANVIYNTVLFNHKHTLNAGLSYVYDAYDETFNKTDYLRTEKVPGIFAEYNFNLEHKFNLILGLRSDFHNLYGNFFTPRIHSRYELFENFILRASAGKAYRTANIFAQNSGILASSRTFILEEELLPEEAWNYGLNATLMFDAGTKQSLILNVDFYRTDFTNQVIADVDFSPQEIRFYNLRGDSYSNSFQADLGWEPGKLFSANAAFRYTDVKTSMHGQQIDMPFVNKYKALLTASFSTPAEKWALDITNQLVGSSPLPGTSSNPEIYQRPENSPAYYILHAQITRKFKYLEIYVGGENLTDFVQENPIIAADEPFGEYFDASFVWGPLLGRAFFAGLRFTIH